MKYTIKFEIYGKRMQVTIEADSEQQAEYMLRGKIKVHSIKELEVTDSDDMFGRLKDMFGMQ